MRELRAGTWRSLALIVVSLAIFLDALDVSIVTIALSHIQVELQMTTTNFAEGSERNKAVGVFSAMVAAGFTAGLVLSGVLITFINWHWVFFMNIPIVLLILLLARLVVSEGRSVVQERSYDLAGAVTVTGDRSYWSTQ